jgi:hypothetical protein
LDLSNNDYRIVFKTYHVDGPARFQIGEPKEPTLGQVLMEKAEAEKQRQRNRSRGRETEAEARRHRL